MSHVIENLVEQGSTSTGPTSIALSIPARAPYRGFSDFMSDGDTTEVMVINRDVPNEWQAAVYTYAAGTLTFVRLLDSPTKSPISFGAGIKRVFVAPLSQRGQWVRRSSNFDVLPGDKSDVDTSAASVTARISADLVEGDRFSFNDFAGTWATNALMVDPNGNEFEDPGDGSDPTAPMECGEPAQFDIVFAGGKLRVR